ncbi:MAG: type IV pilin [Methanoregula sp.]|nr:type IV pilin [Methanoregula sp.]
MVVITIILAAIVLAQIFLLPNFVAGPVPALFNITTIRHVNDDGVMTYDSRMVIKNTGTVAYPNRNLMAKVYRNGIPLSFVIATLNCHDYIAYAHTQGVDIIGGSGCSGDIWSPGEMTYIDFSDRTFYPGDNVQLEVFDNTTRQIISRHSYTA